MHMLHTRQLMSSFVLTTSSRLPRLMNRKFVDEFAVEFCMSMNTKANRKKLARALFSVDKNRCVWGGGREKKTEKEGRKKRECRTCVND